MGNGLTDPNTVPPLWPLLAIVIAAALIVGGLIYLVTS